MTTRRFVPSAAVARRRNLLIAGLAGLLVAVLAWLEGFETWTGIIFAGVATAVLTFGAYELLCRLAGPAVVVLEEEALTIEHRRKLHRLPWAEVTQIRFSRHVLDYMIVGRRGGRPMRVPMEGHDRAAVTEMLALIQARAGQPR